MNRRRRPGEEAGLSVVLNQSLCYWGVAVAYALLLAYVLVAGGRGLLRWHLLLVAAAGAGASAFLAERAGAGFLPTLDPPGFLVEMAGIGSWFLLLNRLLRGPYKQSMPEIVRRALLLLWLALAVLGALGCWYWYARADEAWISGVFSGIALTAALSCLALAAQLSRDAPVEGRAALSMLVAAAALAAVAQVVAMGLALLGSYAPPAILLARAAALVIAAALLGRAVHLQPQWSLAIFVSPQARTYVPRFMAMAGVLAVLLAVMPFCRSLEPDAAHPLGLLVIGLTGSPVVALLFSQSLSARARVFLSKHFLPFRYDYREEWLRLIDTLASPDQRLPLPERAIKSVAQIVGSPAGLLWMRREPEGPFVCAAGWNTKMWSDQRVAAEDPIIAFMFERQWILDTAELARNPAMYNGLSRPDWLEQFPDALLLVPLISNEVLMGFMLLLQSSSAFRLTFEEIDLLRTSGRQVAAHLAQYEADQRLAEAKQFEAFNRLTAFLMHDLKNLIAQQSLVVKNAARHKGNPEFVEDAIATIDNSVARMSNLLQQLQSGEAGGRRSRVRISSALQDAVERCRGRSPEPRIVEADEGLHAQIDRDRFAMVAAHLIRNAQEATAGDGSVEVRVLRAGGQAIITIRDDGCGMDPDFVRTRLFRPFDSTKGSKGMGIGAYQARSLVVDSGGTLDVESEPGRGTCITIRLPLAEPAEAQS
jgi:putative PEP-CTERM system histidine kinase